MIPAKEEGVLFDGGDQAGCSGKAWSMISRPEIGFPDQSVDATAEAVIRIQHLRPTNWGGGEDVSAPTEFYVDSLLIT